MENMQEIEVLVNGLTSKNRKIRQESAHEIAVVASQNPNALVGYIDNLIEATKTKEAQTRWELFDALSCIAPIDTQAAAKAFDEAQDALYDEESGVLRASAFRFFTTIGSLSPQWSKETLPFIDDAIKYNHGNPEYYEMLDEALKFVQANVDPGVADALAARMAFDAQSTHSDFTRHARKIIKAVK